MNTLNANMLINCHAAQFRSNVPSDSGIAKDTAIVATIGANVAKRRKELRLSQQKLSAKLELYAVYVCRGSISRIEDFSRTVTDIELFAIAKALKTDICELIDETILNG